MKINACCLRATGTYHLANFLRKKVFGDISLCCNEKTVKNRAILVHPRQPYLHIDIENMNNYYIENMNNYYEHDTEGRTDSHSDYSAHLPVVQY